MILTTISKIKSKNVDKLNVIDELCFNSKNLYNKSLYSIRQYFFENKKYLNYNENYKIIKDSCNEEGIKEYYQLNTNSSQQTMKCVDSNFKSFFALLKKKSNNDYDSKVRIPKYLDKNGRYKVIFTKIAFQIKDKYVNLSTPKYLKEKYNLKDLTFKIPKNINPLSIKEIHLLPFRKNSYKLAFIHEKKEEIKVSGNGLLGIDLGVDNLVSMLNCISGESILIDGKVIKSINRYFNKSISVLQSISKKSNDKFNTNKLNYLYDKRLNIIKDYLHKVSTYIIDYCVFNNISKIIIGHNNQWKTNSNIGKKNNQNFLNIPHSLLMEYISYKGELVGIQTIIQEESYTSKVDNLALEELPTLEKKKSKKLKNEDINISKTPKRNKKINPLTNKPYLGKRVKRGLFSSSIRKLISSDINGCLGIVRKYLSKQEGSDLVQNLLYNGLVFNPLKKRISQKII